VLNILILPLNFLKTDVFSAPKFAFWTTIFRQEDISIIFWQPKI